MILQINRSRFLGVIRKRPRVNSKVSLQAAIGETACSNTMVSFGSQCLILGGRGIHIYSIRSWTDRVNFFSKQKMYSEALRFAISYYNDEIESTNSNRVGFPQ